VRSENRAADTINVSDFLSLLMRTSGAHQPAFQGFFDFLPEFAEYFPFFTVGVVNAFGNGRVQFAQLVAITH
jgi:hypothetical protein